MPNKCILPDLGKLSPFVQKMHKSRHFTQAANAGVRPHYQTLKEKNMFRKNITATCTALTVMAFVSPLNAMCPTKTIFSCTTTKGKVVEVCESTNSIEYSFGKSGQKPELSLSVQRSAATTKQWDGMGRNMYYSILIPNGNTTYEVFSNADKLGEESSYGIYVTVSGKEVATINCNPETVTDNIEGVELNKSSE